MESVSTLLGRHPVGYRHAVHQYVVGESSSMFVGSIGTLLESPPVVYLRVDYRYVAGNEDNRKVQ